MIFPRGPLTWNWNNNHLIRSYRNRKQNRGIGYRNYLTPDYYGSCSILLKYLLQILEHAIDTMLESKEKAIGDSLFNMVFVLVAKR
ncbi:hypothetical protein N9F09_01615 [Schleiferiaceae bacterium]|nr:hypothetical protein [Schleiferiaceae bacterium]MDB0057577.1 hypothetical protein [Schleiferiaceae bacterium]